MLDIRPLAVLARAWPGMRRGSSTGLSLRILGGFGLIAALALVVLTGVVEIGTARQDDAAAQASVRLANTAMGVKKEELGRVLRDYVIWPEAHDQLMPTVNLAWLYDGMTIGANIYESLRYEYAFVIDRADKTIYALNRGEVVQVDAFALASHGLDRLVALAREQDDDTRTVNGVIWIDGMPALASAGVVWADGANGPFANAPVMVFVDLLDADVIQAVSSSYLLRDLRLEATPDSGPGSTIPIVAADGATLGALHWQPDRPGSALLSDALPAVDAVGLGFLVLAGLVGLSLRRATTRVAASEERFRDLAEVASDWFWETDEELRFCYFSDRVEASIGRSPEHLLGKTLLEITGPNDELENWCRHSADLDAKRPFRDFSFQLAGPVDEVRHGRISGKPVFGGAGRFEGYRGTGSDITAEVESAARLEYLRHHDQLTGLANRLHFCRRLDEAVATARREGRPSATVYLDLDDFKDVNDALGHPAGDALLCQLAARLREIARETDTFARLNGDEFAFVLAGCGDPAEAAAFCRRVLELLAEPFAIDGQAVQVSASMGVAFLPADAQDTAQAMQSADLALNRAKSEGSGLYRFYAAEMNVELQRRHRGEQELRRAIAAEEFELHFQPKYCTQTLRLVGVEALLRWNHPERGMVMPDQFIDLAERTGLIVPIGEWVLEEACGKAARWPGLGIAVNLSPAQFRCPNLVDAVTRALVRSGLEPGRLELEVTETLLATELPVVQAVLAELKGLGVGLAMDDFGTGYSSLAILQDLPFDRIKIDRSFVARLGTSTEAMAIVRAVVTLGQGLDMATTAEGSGGSTPAGIPARHRL